MSAEQLPLPFIPPDVVTEVTYTEQIIAHLGIIQDLIEQVNTALAAPESPEEITQLLIAIKEIATDAGIFCDLLHESVIALGRERDLFQAQRNEAVRNRDQLVGGLYAWLARLQRKVNGG